MIKFEIQIDPADGRQLEAASQFLAALAGKTDKDSSKEVEAPEAEPEPEPEPEPAEAPTKKKEATLKKEVKDLEPEEAAPKKKAKAPEPEEDDPEEDGVVATEPEITLDDLRAIVAVKAKLHKEALRAKLAKLGAKNVPTLAPSKFAEFYEYAKSLK